MEQRIAELSLSTAGDLDGGKVGSDFARELLAVVGDIIDRSGDPRARKLKLELTMKPVAGDNGQLEKVDVEADVTSKMPSRRSQATSCTPRKNLGALTFQPLLFDGDHEEDPKPGKGK